MQRSPKLARFARVAGRNLARAVRDPQTLRPELDEVTEAAVRRATAAFAATSDEQDVFRRAALRARTLRETLSDAFPTVVPYAGVVIAGPVLALRVLTRLSGATDEGDHGVSHSSSRSPARCRTTSPPRWTWPSGRSPDGPRRPGVQPLVADLVPAELADRYASGGLSPAVTAALDGFLAAYGMRGIGEIDLGRPRWSDDPADVLATVQRYQDIRRTSRHRRSSSGVSSPPPRRSTSSSPGPAARGAGWSASSPAGSGPWPAAGSCRSSPSSG